jgi:hypothetical protein
MEETWKKCGILKGGIGLAGEECRTLSGDLMLESGLQ